MSDRTFTADEVAEMIARARQSERATITADLRAIHQDGGESQGYDMTRGGEYGDLPHCCTECGTFGEYGIPWPCPTLRALGVES